jgi:hypothetical protein
MRLSVLPLILMVLTACQPEENVLLEAPGKGPMGPTAGNPIGAFASVGTVSTLRQSEIVKAYKINRYVDPADSRVLHERHAVYRLEEQPAWIARSPKDENRTIHGPIVGMRKPEYAPEPVPGETAREIFQARRGIEEANQRMKELRESQEKLTNSVEVIAKDTAEAERKLTNVVSVLNQRIKHLEGDTSGSADDQAQMKAVVPGESDVIVRSANP